MVDSGYRDEYRKKLTTADKAAEKIESGNTIVHGPGPSAPPALLSALADRARAGCLSDIKVYSLCVPAIARSTYLSPDLYDCIQAYTWFLSNADRELARIGLDYYVPCHYHQVPRFIKESMQVDITLATVSPMDGAGYFTFGLVNDYTSTAARFCRRLIVEVNENMPRVFGQSLLHISEVDTIIENTVPLVEMPLPEAQPGSEQIASHIVEMVPDGATIQIGWGGIPNLVAKYLLDRKDLGIHSEMFSPVMVDLIKKGAVTGRRKTLHPRKSVFTSSGGNREMFEFMHDNPGIESYPVSYTNNPAVIAQNDNMISVNAILQVDLLGQCNAEYLDGHEFSGTGGQLDYVRGAYASNGGKSILAFYATARNGTVSRVVPRLDPGTVITTPRNDVHYLATEYGAVNLKGKSTRDRALDIISLAHPQFRDELLKEAENMYLL